MLRAIVDSFVFANRVSGSYLNLIHADNGNVGEESAAQGRRLNRLRRETTSSTRKRDGGRRPSRRTPFWSTLCPWTSSSIR